MRAAVGQGECKDPAVLVFRYGARSRECNPELIGLAHVRQKNAPPIESLSRDVLYVKDEIGEALVENAGLHFERNLFGNKFITYVTETTRGLRRNGHRHREVRGECDEA